MHPSTLKIKLLTQEIAAAGKEYPAPWLKNGGSITRSPDGRFGSPSGASKAASDAIAGARHMTGKAIRNLGTRLVEIGDAIDNLPSAEKDAVLKASFSAESNKKMDELEAQVVEGTEKAIRQAREQWESQQVKEALTTIDKELQKLESDKSLWTEAGQKARQSAKALMGAGAIIAGVDAVIAGTINGVALAGAGVLTTGIGSVIAGTGALISLTSIVDYEDKDKKAKKLGGATKGLGGLLATKAGPAMIKAGISVGSSLIGFGLAEAQLGYSMATSDQSQGFIDSLEDARDKLRKAQSKRRRRGRNSTEAAMEEAQEAIERALQAARTGRR